jgi:hypothetical protein
METTLFTILDEKEHLLFLMEVEWPDRVNEYLKIIKLMTISRTFYTSL